MIEDKFIKGGLRVVDSLAERDAINSLNKKAGMIVINKTDKRLYQLQDDLTTYQEVQLGGGGGLSVRQTAIHKTIALEDSAVESFDLDLGKSAIIYNLQVDNVCMVEAYGKNDFSDTNPYRFVSALDHLVDDGSTYLVDGTRVYGRRHTIVANLDDPLNTNIHWRVTNLSNAPAEITLTVNFLPLE